MPKDKNSGKKLADMLYGNPEGAAFGVYPQAKRGQRIPSAKEQLAKIMADERAMELPQFGDVDLSVPTAGNRSMGQRMVERDVDLKRQADRDMSPLEKLAGGIQTGRLMGSGLVQAAKSIPTAITKGGKAAEDYIAENIYKPTQPKAYEYAQDIGDFLSSLETDYKIPPVLPEAVALQYLAGPAKQQAGRVAKDAAKQGALNLAAPRTLHPQAGAIVFHGTPHKFPPTKKNPLGEFNPEKIGTGEGNQAYGYGHYTAGEPTVAKEYRRKLGDVSVMLGDTSLDDLIAQGGDTAAAAERLKRDFLNSSVAQHPDDVSSPMFWKQTEDFYKTAGMPETDRVKSLIEKFGPISAEAKGSLYEVDLPDEQIARMLDFDKPLSSQHPDVQRVLMEHPDVLDYIAKAEGQRTKLNEMSPVRLEKIPSASVPYDANRMAGKDVMTAIAQRSGAGTKQGAVEEQLRQLGIPGIKYLDEQSRGTTGTGKWRIKLPEGEEKIYNFKPDDDALKLMNATAEPYGTQNFIVFPGNEDLLNIVDRKAQGGPVHFSDNPDTMALELAGGGAVKSFAGGGVALDDYSNYGAKPNSQMVNIPGVGEILTFWDHPNKRVIVSDEGYWNPKSPTGDRLAKAVQWARDQGYQAGVVATPYASNRFGDGVTTTAGGHTRSMPGATDQQLREYIDAADFVVTDPYLVSGATATQDVQDNFANFTRNVGDYANSQGKDTWLYLQGFGTPDVDAKTVQDYNTRIAAENAGRYNDMSFFNMSDFGHAGNPNEDHTGFYQLNTQDTVNAATKAAEPFKMAEQGKFSLPSDWSTFKPEDKIDYFNKNNIDANTLINVGVAQSDIDWMKNHGYAGGSPQPLAQAQPQGSAAQNNVFGYGSSPYASDDPYSTTRQENILGPLPEAPTTFPGYPEPPTRPTPYPSYGDINSYVQANIGNPGAISDAIGKYGVSASDLAAATGYTNDEIDNYFSSAGINPYTQSQTALVAPQFDSYTSTPAVAAPEPVQETSEFNNPIVPTLSSYYMPEPAGMAKGGKVSFSTSPEAMRRELLRRGVRKAAGGGITADDLILEERKL